MHYIFSLVAHLDVLINVESKSNENICKDNLLSHYFQNVQNYSKALPSLGSVSQTATLMVNCIVSSFYETDLGFQIIRKTQGSSALQQSHKKRSPRLKWKKDKLNTVSIIGETCQT